MRTAIYDVFDVVIVPFPFTDRLAEKRRPALVLSSANTFGTRAGHHVLAMITSSKRQVWPLDVDIDDLDQAGLTSPSLVRMKWFTLDERLILRKSGHLVTDDQARVRDAALRLLGLEESASK